MIDGSEKRNRQLAFELQNSHVWAVYKSGTGTWKRVCGNLGLGDARLETWGHQVWDAGTSKTGTQGTRVVNDYRKSRR